MTLEEFDDSSYSLIFPRGDADLKKFAELREISWEPLTPAELFYITEYILEGMAEL